MKPGVLKNILVKTMLFCVFIICLRFMYMVTNRGDSCADGNFCFFQSDPDTLEIIIGSTAASTAAAALSTVTAVASDRDELWTTKDYRKPVQFYSSVFQDLISEGFLSPESNALCVDTSVGHDVLALKELGVRHAVGVSDKASKPLVVSYKNKTSQPFGDETFDFVFSGGGPKKRGYADFAGEVARTLKPEGYLVVHTKSNDTYSLHSFIALFNCCTFIKSREFSGFDDNSPYIREIVMKKELGWGIPVNSNNNECSYAGYKRDIVQRAEPLIGKEPLKPWITLKKNMQTVKYLPSMVDISYKSRYVYIDVGARSYGSSIGSWFRKQYPKQNNTFEVYAIEADKTFHGEYSKKKLVKLLPYAAWVRNETLFFEVNHDPGDDAEEKGKTGGGMGRIKPVQSDAGLSSRVAKIIGFDFANWLKSTVTEKDFVVMKMDVEGTEFQLIPRLIETGAICLIDEIFLECHYNRWQRCCPGERSAKYDKTYGQCLDLFTSLRKSGVLVHQWW